MQSTIQSRQRAAERPHSHSSIFETVKSSLSHSKPARAASWPGASATDKQIHVIHSQASNDPAAVDDSAAIDAILRELVGCVKSFKCPSDLDFSFNPTNPMILASTAPNKPFINQLRQLHGLQSRLSDIQTSGNEQLVKKHRVTQAAIAQALQRMKEQQIKLHQKFTESAKETADQVDEAEDTFEVVESSSEMAADSAIDSKLKKLVELVKGFKCPSELDISDSNDPMVLVNNEKNRPFIDQRRKLETLQKGFAEIRTSNDEQRNRLRAAEAAVVMALESMKKQQIKLCEKAKAQENTRVPVRRLSREVRDRQMRLCGDVTNAMINPESTINEISRELFTCVTEFKCPNELDFSEGVKNALPSTENNRAFITQLRKLDELRTRLVDIPVHGNEGLEAKHKAAGMAIGQALQRMKQYQLNCYEKHTKAYRPCRV